jgi:putative component of membrane protein insertase Oxa1/YidC/SpoIIIJ protein YidD
MALTATLTPAVTGPSAVLLKRQGLSSKNPASSIPDAYQAPASQLLAGVKPAPRIVIMANGRPGLNVNGLSYADYIKHIMPHAPLTPTERWGTWMLRKFYQGTTRNTVYKWFGNPCRYKKEGNLSCSEYTLLLMQTCGFKRAVTEGWRRINDEDPTLRKHPLMFLATLPVLRQQVLKHYPDVDPKKLPTGDAPLPLNWFKNPDLVNRLARL